MDSNLRVLFSNTAQQQQKKQSYTGSDLGVLMWIASGCLTVDFFLLNAEVQVQTCHCIPAKSSTLSQWSCLGSTGPSPFLKPPYLHRTATVFKAANVDRPGESCRQVCCDLQSWCWLTRPWADDDGLFFLEEIKSGIKKTAESAGGLRRSRLIIHLAETDLQQVFR